MTAGFSQGIDMLSVSRLRLAISRSGERFLKRIFTENELSGGRDLPYLARRFAAKEAFFKALGTGLDGGTRWHDIEVLNDRDGRPMASVSGRSLSLVGGRTVMVSVSSTAETAVAFVVVS